MALLFMDSFDHYTTADLLTKWTNIQASNMPVTIESGQGRRGSNCLRQITQNQSTNILIKALGPSDNTVIVGFAMRPQTPNASIGMFMVLDTGAGQVFVRLNVDQTISVCRGDNAGNTVLGTTSVALPTNVYSYVEMKFTIHNTAGTVDVRIDGVSRLSLTAQNTRNTSSNTWNAIGLGSIGGATFGMVGQRDYDDLYVLDGTGPAPWNAFLGDCRVDPCYAIGAGATSGWTPSVGANWQCVDDAAPSGDADFTTASAPATDTFVLQDAPSPGSTIFGVQHCFNLRKMDAGVCAVAPVVRHGGVDYVGTPMNPPTNYSYLFAVQATNPGTSAQWLESDFNAAEFGYRRTS